jgi:hypothetical protein
MRPRLAKYIVCMMLFCVAAVSHGQQVRSVPDSVAHIMKNEKDFRYANDPSYWQEKKPAEDSAVLKMIAALSNSIVLKWMIFLVIATILIYAVYQVIVVNNFFIFSRRGKSKNNVEENEIPDNLEERIQAAVAAKEYRHAVRFYYLKTLTALNAGNRIKLHRKATNYDYLQQMKGSPTAGDFFRLTSIYEYVWYGQFEPDAGQYEVIRNNFDQFNKRI